MLKICIAGGCGFIGSHLAKKLKMEGHKVIIADIKINEYFLKEEICDELLILDLRKLESCLLATKNCDIVYNLAADMGGMGFIQSNNALILYNNTMISFNMVEACRQNKIKKILFTSSACVYPEDLQMGNDTIYLKEKDAWPANPQDAYGLEKIVSEQLYIHYYKDFNLDFCIARLHNIYGPKGTWKDGREKAPSAFCRKILCSNYIDEIEMWGDGKQIRSFCYIDDCVEGLIKLMNSSYKEPLNIGSVENINMNEMHDLICSFEDKKVFIKHVKGPEGVKCRSSDNTNIKKILNWEPKTKLCDGLKKLYFWMKDELKNVDKNTMKKYKKSVIIKKNII